MGIFLDRHRDIIKHDMLFTNDTANFNNYENYKNAIFFERSQNMFYSKNVLNRRNDVLKENSNVIHSRYKSLQLH